MGLIVRPEIRITATISLAASAVILLCFLWWMDHENLTRENQAIRRQLQSIEERIQELYRSRAVDASR
jgi:hypothetical protein